MKLKRILAILLVVIVAASIFAGCDVISKNQERDNDQALATVNYRGLSATVTKGDFYSSFNSLAYYYIAYYGYTVEETADAVLDSLANRKLLILYARTILAEQMSKDVTVDIAELMTPVMKNEAIKSANETMQTQYDSIFEELWKEAYPETDDETENDEEEEETTEEEKDTPRPSRPDKAEAEPDYDSTAVVADPEIPFFEQPNHYKDDYTAEQKVISDKAIAQLKKQLTTNYVSYDYYLNSAYETQVLTKYQHTMGKDYVLTSDGVKALIAAQRNDYIAKNKENFNFNVETNYSAALATLSSLVYHPVSEEGYGYVYNILLKFSDEQTAALTDFKNGHSDKDLIAAYRNALAQQITVNVTNPDYDAEAKEDEENSNMYSEENVAAFGTDGIIERIFNDIQEAFTQNGFDAAREAAIKWLYLVNDDTGMYDTEKNNAIANGNLGYLITPEDKKSSYVDEFTALGRTLITNNEDSVAALEKTGAMKEIVGQGLGSYGYVVTDYGIHIMFVSYIPYDEAQISDEADKTNNVLPLDYVVYYGRYDDENDNNKTLEQAIFDSMKDSYINLQYTKIAQGAINDYKEESISTNDKLWKKIMKELKKAYEG